LKHISLILSEKCNLNCSYCYITDKQSNKKISFNIFKEEFEKIYDKSEEYRLDVMGGEPLLQMDLVNKFIEYGTKKKFSVKIMTNGMLLTHQIIENINKNNVTVSVSYDGLWQEERSKEYSTELINMIKTINDLEVHSMWNGMKFNLTENHIFLKKLFGVEPQITMVRDIGIWNEKNIEQSKKSIDNLIKYSIDTNTIPGFLKHFLPHILRYHKKGYIPKDCGAGQTIISFHNNKFYSCYRYFDKEEMFKEEMKSDKRMYQFCQGCEVYNYCEKGCLVQQLENQKPIEYLCEMYKHIYNTLRININKLNKDEIVKMINYV